MPYKGSDFAPHNMTGPSNPSPYVITSSTGFGSPFENYRAFDSTPGTYFISLGTALTLTLDIGAGNAKPLYSYAVRANTVPEGARMPKDWTLAGSNDGSTWTTLSTVTSQTAWTSGEVRHFVCTVSGTAYRYFRFASTTNNGDGSYTQLAEMYLYEAAAIPDLTPLPVVPPYVVTALNYAVSAYNYVPQNVFDGSAAYQNSWTSTTQASWLKLDIGSATPKWKVGSYSLQSSLDNPGWGLPKDFTLEGSNDDASWTALDTRTGVVWGANGQIQTFTCSVVLPFRYFRLNITASTTGGSNTHVAEMHFFGVVPQIAQPQPFVVIG